MHFWSKVFFFKTTGQIALIFGIQVPRDDLIQVCSNCDEICNFVFLRLFLSFFGQFFFFKTAGHTALIFGMQVMRDDLIQICSNCDEICNFVFLNHFLLPVLSCPLILVSSACMLRYLKNLIVM